MHVNKSKLERNSSLEYYLMTFIEETKQVYLAVNQFFFSSFYFCTVFSAGHRGYFTGSGGTAGREGVLHANLHVSTGFRFQASDPKCIGFQNIKFSIGCRG